MSSQTLTGGWAQAGASTRHNTIDSNIRFIAGSLTKAIVGLRDTTIPAGGKPGIIIAGSIDDGNDLLGIGLSDKV